MLINTWCEKPNVPTVFNYFLRTDHEQSTMKARVAEWTTGIDLNTTDGRRDRSYYPTELYCEGNETNFQELEMAMKMYAILFRNRARGTESTSEIFPWEVQAKDFVISR